MLGEIGVVEFLLMKAKEYTTLTEKQVSVIKIPQWMFDMVRNWGMMNGIVVDDRIREYFWYFVKNSIIKCRGRHGCKRERGKHY